MDEEVGGIDDNWPTDRLAFLYKSRRAASGSWYKRGGSPSLMIAGLVGKVASQMVRIWVGFPDPFRLGRPFLGWAEFVWLSFNQSAEAGKGSRPSRRQPMGLRP